MMHPLTMIFIAVLISSLSIISGDPTILTFLLIICLFLALSSNIYQRSLMKIGKYLLFLMPVVISMSALQLLFNRNGDVLIHLNHLVITSQGLKQACAVALRLLILLFVGMWLWNLSIRDYVAAFRSIGISDTFSVLVSISMRFLPIFASRIKVSREQLLLRGYDLKRISLYNKLILYKSLIVPILGWTLHEVKFQAITLDLS